MDASCMRAHLSSMYMKDSSFPGLCRERQLLQPTYCFVIFSAYQHPQLRASHSHVGAIPDDLLALHLRSMKQWAWRDRPWWRLGPPIV